MLSLHCEKSPAPRHLRVIEDALVALEQQSAEFGFEAAGYLYSPRPPDPRGPLQRPRSMGIHSRVFPLWWKDAYLQQEMWRIDPVYQATLTTTLPVWWSYDARPRLVVTFKDDATSAQNVMFQRCFETTQVRTGLSVPMHAAFGSTMGYIVFATRAPLADITRHGRTCEDTLLAIAHRFHHDIAPLLPLGSETDVKLSSRELDCLSLAAIGKTLDETAIILSLSRSTVRFHMRNACRKLGAGNRMQAITRAAYFGLLGAIY